MRPKVPEACYVNDRIFNTHRYHAHSDNNLAFYTHNGEFISLSSGFVNSSNYSFLKQIYTDKIIKNIISNASFTIDTITSFTIDTIHYVPEKKNYVFNVKLLNNLIEYVEDALGDNELYQINKFKRLAGIDVGYSPKNPGRVIIYSPRLMSYYDGLNWEKIHPQLII